MLRLRPIPIMLILLIIPIANAQQIWYLTGDSTGSTYVMFKIPPKNASKSPIDIPSNGKAIWIADEQAKTNLTFANANWSINLTVNAKKGGSINVSIGVWDGSSFFSYGSYDLNLNAGKNLLSFELPMSSFRIPKGCWLALCIENVGDSDVKVKVWRGGWIDTIKYPYGNPPYPVPEASSVILVISGLIVVWVLKARYIIIVKK